MTNSNHNIDDMSIVPERDELHSHRKTKRGTSRSAGTEKVVQTGGNGTSGMVKFFLTLSILGVIAAGAAGYLFYTQGQMALANFAQAENRIVQLENRLSMVGEAAEQTSMGFLERVDFNFSEIDKLWAARNQNVAGITANKVALDGQADSLSAFETAISSQASNLNQQSSTLDGLDGEIEALRSNFGGMDNLGVQLTRINTDLTGVKNEMASLENDFINRINATELDIDSINSYRLQLNQRLNTIQDNINSLQQRVGQ